MTGYLIGCLILTSALIIAMAINPSERIFMFWCGEMFMYIVYSIVIEFHKKECK